MKTKLARLLPGAMALGALAAPAATVLPPLTDGLRAPARVAADAAGNLYVVESAAGRVIVFDAFGRPAVAKEDFAKPLAIAVDAAGSFVVSELAHGSVSEFDSQWTLRYQLGAGAGEFALPNYLAVDPAPGGTTVYVCDAGANRIKAYRQGSLVAAFGGTGTANGQFNFPAGVCVSRAGEVFVVDQGNDRVQVFNRSGGFLRSFRLGAGGMFGGPSGRAQGLTGDAQGRLYVADAFQGLIKIFDAQGNPLGTLGGFGQAAGLFRTPVDVAIDSLNRLCVASANNGRVELLGLDDFRHVRATPPSPVVASGSRVTFTAAAGGTGPFTYQWRRGTNSLSDGGHVSGATTPALHLTGVTVADDGAYSVVIVGLAGTWVSPDATLTVLDPPQIVTGPASQAVYSGATVSFNIVATGDALVYQWQHNGADIAGATASSLTLANVQLEDGGVYLVSVRNPVGAVTSDPATLTVLRPPSPPHLDAFTPLPAGGFYLALTADAGFRYAVESSTNLMDWTVLTDVTSETGGLEIALPDDPGQPMVFYRVKWTP